ncbi:MAG: primosomal protein N' [Dehalococcoidia bacterium]|nr:primosomal protein N' [Dehalococcoidia bacterium]
MPYAEVAVNAAAPLRQTFTYRIPAPLSVVPGQAVYVPFGARTLQGIVMEVTEEAGFRAVRDIEALIDPQPMLSPAHLALARLLSDYYLAPLFDCVSLMLPAGFKRRPLALLRATERGKDVALRAGALSHGETKGAGALSHDEAERAGGLSHGETERTGALSHGEVALPESQRRVLEYVLERGEVESEELRRGLKMRGVQAAAGSLLRTGLIERSYRLARPAVTPKVVPHVRLLRPEEEVRAEVRRLRGDASSLALRRAVVLERLADEGALPRARARALGLTPAVLRDLQAEGWAAVEDVTVVRDPLSGRAYAQRPPSALMADQRAAVEAICAALEVRAGALTHGREGGAPEAVRLKPDPPSGDSVFLLHGVTGSGKTEVYLAALERAVTLGKRAIVLVPEISLTPQTVRRFGERFPGQVAVMHSELPLGEHFDMWHEVRDGRYAVVIGPRGALFAPQPDLGLVIIDEEHEWTYKQQEGSPRYHARRAAEELCQLTGAVLVLGSATPDVESHFRAQDGSYRLLELPQRLLPADGAVTPGPLPEVEVVDLRSELKAGNRSIFSRSLAGAVRRALDAGEQVMLFLNRRGTAAFVQCRDCGHVPECRQCAVALTYHLPEAALVCHYCRRRRPLPAACPQCGGGRIRQVGLGTERVEEEARLAFRGARTLRWDRDVTRGRDAHEAILARFLSHEADILIGTQMIAKGLDIPLVTLVGVISADIALHLPDFRAGERAFQLLEQVAGRAGRGPKGGRVIIQTYTPDHYAIEAAAAHDYHALYRREIEFRRRLGYPPFGRLVRLTYAHTGAAYAQGQAAMMARRLKVERDRLGLANLDVLGPSPAFVPRLRGRWRWNVVLRGNDPAAVLRDTALPRGWTADVDPVSLL